MREVATKTFKEYESDDWFVLGVTLIVGIGIAILLVTIYNSFK